MSRFIKLLLVVVIGVILGWSSSLIRSTNTPASCNCRSSVQRTLYGFPAKYFEKDVTFYYPAGSKSNTVKSNIHLNRLAIDLLAWFIASLAVIYVIYYLKNRKPAAVTQPPEPA